MDQQTQNATSLAQTAIRNAAALMDMQIGITRELITAQARNAKAYGAPDYSELFNVTAEHQRRLVKATTDQMLDTAGRVVETMNNLQRQFAGVVEQQSRKLTEEMVRDIGRLGEGTEQAMRKAGDQLSGSAQEIERASNEARRTGSAILRPEESEVTSKSRQGGGSPRANA
jgi:hypothetical protein